MASNQAFFLIFQVSPYSICWSRWSGDHIKGLERSPKLFAECKTYQIHQNLRHLNKCNFCSFFRITMESSKDSSHAQGFGLTIHVVQHIRCLVTNSLSREPRFQFPELIRKRISPTRYFWRSQDRRHCFARKLWCMTQQNVHWQMLHKWFSHNSAHMLVVKIFVKTIMKN